MQILTDRLWISLAQRTPSCGRRLSVGAGTLDGQSRTWAGQQFRPRAKIGTWRWAPMPACLCSAVSWILALHWSALQWLPGCLALPRYQWHQNDTFSIMEAFEKSSLRRELHCARRRSQRKLLSMVRSRESFRRRKQVLLSCPGCL